MTDQSTTNTETPKPQTASHADWLLRSFVQIMNDTKGARLGITLQVGGLLVSGHLASGAEYLEELGKGLDAALNNEGRLEAVFKNLAQRMYPEEDEKRPIEHIHIHNVRFFMPSGSGPIPQSSQVWWRGRLSEVSGFVLGVMSAE